MADSQRRELRIRKPPTYLNSDEEDADAVLKIRPTYKKDAKQNQMQVGAMSKLLVKFITQANQRPMILISDFRAAQKDAKKQKTDKQKKTDVPVPKSIARVQNTQQSIVKKSWTDQMKKQDKAPFLKTTPLSKEQAISRYSSKQLPAKINIQSNLISHLYACQDAQGNINIERLRTQFPELKQYIATIGPDKIQKHIHDILTGNVKGLQQKKQESAQRQKISRKNLSGNQQKNSQGSNSGQQFKFKRAAYHIAIAYHIHVKKIENNSTKVDFDPTAFAKKLRQQRMSPGGQRDTDKKDSTDNKA